MIVRPACWRLRLGDRVEADSIEVLELRNDVKPHEPTRSNLAGLPVCPLGQSWTNGPHMVRSREEINVGLAMDNRSVNLTHYPGIRPVRVRLVASDTHGAARQLSVVFGVRSVFDLVLEITQPRPEHR